MERKPKVDIFSHNFKVTGFNREVYKGLLDFCRPLMQIDSNKGPGGTIDSVKAVFAASTGNRDEFRFHINLLNEFFAAMKLKGFDKEAFEIVYHKTRESEPLEIKLKDSITPYDYQIPIVDFFATENEPIRVCTLQTGKGKATSLETRLKVPNGWVTMGDIAVGDEIIAKDGSITHVVETTTLPSSLLHNVNFEDGRKLNVHLEHQWEVVWVPKAHNVLNDLPVSERFVCNTSELMTLLGTGEVYIPLCDSEHCSAKAFERSPTEEAERVIKDGTGRGWSSTFIDEAYLAGSTEQRWELLRAIAKNFEYDNSEGVFDLKIPFLSLFLVEQLRYLIRSLGGIAFIYMSSEPGPTKYRLMFRLKEPERLFSDAQPVAHYSDMLKVVSITPSELAVSKCIEIAHPEALYVAEDFIVTHNTLCGLAGADKVAKRFAIVVPGMFTDKWYSDVLEAFECTADDILLIRGTKSLYKTIEAAKQGLLKAQVIIVSSTTLQIFINEYEENSEAVKEMACHPEELYQVLGVGYRIIDEFHKPAHLNFKLDLYTHIAKAVYLSATIDSNDKFLTKMRAIAYPHKDRYSGLAYDKYIEVRAMEYSIENASKIRCKNFKGQYSHTAFEKSLMKQKTLLKEYFELIYDTLKTEWSNDRKDGMKALLFCATVELCTLLTDFLRGKYPTLKVGRYVSADDYNKMLENEITVSTVLSAGTGVDIPGLVYCLMTTAIDSVQTNEQALGRLRKPKQWPDLTPVFTYLYCTDIPRHVVYHVNKKRFFDGKCKVHKTFISSHKLGAKTFQNKVPNNKPRPIKFKSNAPAWGGYHKPLWANNKAGFKPW